MEYKKFKKYMSSIMNANNKTGALSGYLEKYLCSSSFCIVDICDELSATVMNLLADYYDCYFEIQGVVDNEISWWIYDDEKIVRIASKNSPEKIIDVSTLKKFWQYLENSKKEKQKEHK